MISTEHSKELNRQRIRNGNYEKAEQYRAESEAIRQNAWSNFLNRHTGYKAVQSKSVFFDCAANRQILERFITETLDRQIDQQSLETAFQACRDRLAQFPKKEYVRRSNGNQLFIAQQRSFAPAGKVAPFTKAALLAMSKTELQHAVKQYGVKEINRILSSSN